MSQAKGKMDFDVKPEDLAKVMGLPKAALANTNMHSLL
jgi:hypothetical protein